MISHCTVLHLGPNSSTVVRTGPRKGLKQCNMGEMREELEEITAARGVKWEKMKSSVKRKENVQKER